MGTRIKVNADSSKITAVEVRTIGTPGESCLLTTAAIARLNAGAIVEPTQEMFTDDQEQDNTLSLGG